MKTIQMHDIQHKSMPLTTILRIININQQSQALLSTIPFVYILNAQQNISGIYECQEIPKAISFLSINILMIMNQHGDIKIMQKHEIQKQTKIYKSIFTSKKNVCPDVISLSNTKKIYANSQQMILIDFDHSSKQLKSSIFIKNTQNYIIRMSSSPVFTKQQIPDYILTANLQKKCRLWSLEYQTLIQQYQIHDDPLAIKFIHKNLFLCGGYSNNKICMFDIRTQKKINTIKIHSNASKVNCLQYNQNIIVSGEENNISIYDIRFLQKQQQHFFKTKSGQITDMAWKTSKLIVSDRKGGLSFVKFN